MTQIQTRGFNYLIVYDVLIVENEDSMRIANRPPASRTRTAHAQKSGPPCEEWVTAKLPVQNEGSFI